MRLKLALRTYIFLNLSDENSNILWHFVTAIIFGTRNSYLANEKNYVLQYVAQYPDGTSIRTLKTKTQFLRRPFQLSVNKVFEWTLNISALRWRFWRVESLRNSRRRRRSVQVNKHFMANIYAVYCAVKLVLLRKG